MVQSVSSVQPLPDDLLSHAFLLLHGSGLLYFEQEFFSVLAVQEDSAFSAWQEETFLLLLQELLSCLAAHEDCFFTLVHVLFSETGITQASSAQGKKLAVSVRKTESGKSNMNACFFIYSVAKVYNNPEIAYSHFYFLISGSSNLVQNPAFLNCFNKVW